MIDLTDRLLKRYQIRPGKVGRYSVSAVYGIVKGFTSPTEYLKGSTIDYTQATRMWKGKWKHEMVQELLRDDYEIEKKKVSQIVGKEAENPGFKTFNLFDLVGKADFMNEATVYEIKTSDQVLEKAKPWHLYQTKLYCTLFERPQGIVVQPVIEHNKVYLNEIGVTKRSDKWFSTQMEKLAEFHKELLEVTSEGKN